MTNNIRIELRTEDSATEKTLGNVDKRMRDLGKSAAQVAKETEKGAGLVEGSYASLRAELVSNRKALEHLEAGSDAFTEQAAVVSDLEQQFKEAKDEIIRLTKAGDNLQGMAAEVVVVANSVDGLKQRFKEATAAANAAEFGSDEFKEARQEAEKLEAELKGMEAELKGMAAEVVVASNSIEGLESKLKTANAELKKLDPNSEAFKRQAAVVAKVTEELDDANAELKEFTGQKRGIDAVDGSLEQLEKELGDNVAKLRQLRVGTTEWKKQKQVVDQLGRSVASANQKFNSSVGSKVGPAVKDFATGIAGFATLTGGVIAAAGLLKASLNEVERRDKESAIAVATREQSIAGLVQNAGGELTDQIVDRSEATGAVTGADVDKLIAIASSVSSAGITDANEIVDISQTALRSQGGDVGKGAAVAGAAIDLANTLEISVKEAFGVLFQTAGAARPEDIALLGKAAVKATAALTGAGLQAEKAQELFAATTLLTGDKTGEQAVSISNDLTQALRAFQKEGIPETIKVAGEDVEVNVPPRFASLLKGEGLKQLGLGELLKLTRQSSELEQVVESFLPNSQNRAFTEQIVGGSKTFDAKQVLAADSISLATAGARTDKQIGDVEGRRVTGVLSELVDSALDQNLQDTSRALNQVAREAFTKVRSATDTKGLEVLTDRTQEGLASARELAGQSPAQARLFSVRNSLETDLTPADRRTFEATEVILERIDALTKLSEGGDLTPRAANRELAGLKELLEGIAKPDLPEAQQKHNDQMLRHAEQQTELLKNLGKVPEQQPAAPRPPLARDIP